MKFFKDYVEFNSKKYYLEDLIEMLEYTPNDDYICNKDGLCYLVEMLSNSYDIDLVFDLMNSINKDALESEFFIVDCIYFEIYPINSCNDLQEFYDIECLIENFENDEL